MKEKEFKQQVFSLRDNVFRLSLSVLSDSNEAEDVTQDVFLKLWGMRKSLRKRENLKAFVLTIAKNKCLDRIKHRSIKQAKQPEIVSRMETSYSSSSDEKEMAELIKKTIATLPVNQRMIIHMRDVEGYEFAEIEKVLDMKIETIRVNLSRARKTVQSAMIKVMNYGL